MRETRLLRPLLSFKFLSTGHDEKYNYYNYSLSSKKNLADEITIDFIDLSTIDSYPPEFQKFMSIDQLEEGEKYLFYTKFPRKYETPTISMKIYFRDEQGTIYYREVTLEDSIVTNGMIYFAKDSLPTGNIYEYNGDKPNYLDYDFSATAKYKY